MSDIIIDALNTILQFMGDVIVHMDNMVKWWTPVLDSLAKAEDMTHRMRAGADFDNNGLKAIFSRIIHALGSYCDVVSLGDNSSII